jgi:hypothetical protein
MSEILSTNQAFFIAVLAMIGGCLAGGAHCILKSRCTRIKICGSECIRDVIPPDSQINLENV